MNIIFSNMWFFKKMMTDPVMGIITNVYNKYLLNRVGIFLSSISLKKAYSIDIGCVLCYYRYPNKKNGVIYGDI